MQCKNRDRIETCLPTARIDLELPWNALKLTQNLRRLPRIFATHELTVEPLEMNRMNHFDILRIVPGQPHDAQKK